MRHNKHSTETIESHFLGTISAFSIRNHHDAMKERKVEENEVVEKEERMGSMAMVPTLPISPAQRRSHLPSIDLSSPFHFFSFFLHSTPISLEFFLPFADLTCVFLLWLWVDFLGLGCCYGFYFCGCGLALRLKFLAVISFFFFWVNN